VGRAPAQPAPGFKPSPKVMRLSAPAPKLGPMIKWIKAWWRRVKNRETSYASGGDTGTGGPGDGGGFWGGGNGGS
jgi:hypothetical protein